MHTSKAKKLRYPKPDDQRIPKELLPAKRPSAPKPGTLKGGLGNGKPLIEGHPNLRKTQLFKQLAIDTETTGTDFYHGCRPFFVSTCDENGGLMFWEWDVNPWTREVGVWSRGYPTPPTEKRRAVDLFTLKKNLKEPPNTFTPSISAADKVELSKILKTHHFILHNTKFDVRALESIGAGRINLQTVQDTLIASHCLVSNESHKLKDLALRYLNIDDDDQQELRQSTTDARSIARGLGWDIARDGGHPHFPAQLHAPTDGWWVFDTWVPRAMAKYQWFVEKNINFAPWYPGGMAAIEDPADLDQMDESCSHPWWTVLRRYALRDVERTYSLWWLQLEGLEHEGLMPVYEERRRLLEPLYEMEHNGVTVSLDRLNELDSKLESESLSFSAECFEISRKAYRRKRVPKNHPRLDNLNSSRQLEQFLFKDLGIRPGKMTKAGMEGKTNGQIYSTDNETLLRLLDRTEGDNRKFVWNLLAIRAREKSRDYCEEYRRRGTPVHLDYEEKGAVLDDWMSLHTSINITGPDTVRFSSSGPNIQNVGKGGKRKDDPIPSLRSIFGPMPDREWFSIDYSNIEMRIFAYKSGDPQLIEAFESGYSVHLIFAELLYENEWSETRIQTLVEALKSPDKPFGKAKYKSPGEIKDPTHKEILRRMTGEAFKTKYEATFYQWCKNGNFALIYGAGRSRANTTYRTEGAYDMIRTRLPKIDQFMKEKDFEARSHGFITTEGGYRLYVPPTEPHVAVNYYVQGTAGWCMVLAINRVYSYLKTLNERIRREGPKAGSPTYRMTMTIHDELDFDFPIHARNNDVILKIGEIMASSGNDIGVPTPVEIERHSENWSVGKKVKK